MRVLVFCLAAIFFSGFRVTNAFAESRLFTVEVTAIEAMLIDPTTGNFSGDLFKFPKNIFRRKAKNDREDLGTGDILLRIRLQGRSDRNLAPDISLVILEDVQALEGRFFRTVLWRRYNFYQTELHKQNQSTISVLLEDVTCSKLTIAVGSGMGKDIRGNSTAFLPFECDY